MLKPVHCISCQLQLKPLIMIIIGIINVLIRVTLSHKNADRNSTSHLCKCAWAGWPADWAGKSTGQAETKSFQDYIRSSKFQLPKFMRQAHVSLNRLMAILAVL